jgi:hypothetical protein
LKRYLHIKSFNKQKKLRKYIYLKKWNKKKTIKKYVISLKKNKYIIYFLKKKNITKYIIYLFKKKTINKYIMSFSNKKKKNKKNKQHIFWKYRFLFIWINYLYLKRHLSKVYSHLYNVKKLSFKFILNLFNLAKKKKKKSIILLNLINYEVIFL